MSDLEQSIRERAYHLWIAEGQPQGRCDTLWLQAERNLLAERVASAQAPLQAAPKKTTVKKAATAAKKKRAA